MGSQYKAVSTVRAATNNDYSLINHYSSQWDKALHRSANFHLMHLCCQLHSQLTNKQFEVSDICWIKINNKVLKATDVTC